MSGVTAAEIDVDICVGNTTIIDFAIYDLWLAGYSVEEAAKIQQEDGVLQEQMGATMDLVVCDVTNHYHFFYMVEKLLHHPPRFQHQLTFQIPDDAQQVLIEKYYEFDAVMMREILGKKLSSRNRKDLDDVSDKTHVKLRSCRRQFDNLKRVFKAVEDLNGSLVQNIQSLFLMSKELAGKYAAIVFMTNNRFETGKKKLSYLTFEDFCVCAMKMIDTWSYKEPTATKEDVDVDFDRDFVMDLRELRVLLDKDVQEDHKLAVSRKLKNVVTDNAHVAIENDFKLLSKSLITIAYNLNHSKDAKDLFVDVVEKFVEPCVLAKLAHIDVKNFLLAFTETCHYVDTMKHVCPQLLPVWDRYMDTMSTIILQLYHA